MQPPAPFRELALDALRPHHRAAIRQIHVFLQVPAEAFVVILVEEWSKQRGHPDGMVGRVFELDGERTITRGGKQQPQFLHGGER
ncbi:MAG TPA: hypothetical protein VGO11_13340 [Chthoniobacteraceae bacterium]|nr:hypothetical protein [Chthoniobacteraceae bacterium]